MESLVKIIFVVCALGSIVTIVFATMFPSVGAASPPTPEQSLMRIRRFASALNTLVASCSGYLFLFLGGLTVVETLIGVLVVFGLVEVAIRNWKPKLPPRSS